MSVIVLTVFLGLVLVSFFICMFLYHSGASPGAGSERDALLPLQEEKIARAGSCAAKTPSTNDRS